MSLTFVRGDILQDTADALVNPVNCVGVMGRGLALDFKKAHPQNFHYYHTACERGEVKPGKVLLYITGTRAPRFIINFPTKRHWKHESRLPDIAHGLDDLVAVIGTYGIQSMAIPALGVGLGRLSWHLVREQIEHTLSPLQGITIRVYEPELANSP